MSIPRRQRWTQQPQHMVRPDPFWVCRGLRFAVLPGVGLVNLAGQPARPLQTDGLATEIMASGVAYNGNHKAEFPAILPSASGLTMISVWRSRAASQYLSADSTRLLLSNRTSDNLGWGWGRVSAVGGGAGGNNTAQTFVINGVAQYIEANYTIESLIDTPVACRYSKETGKVAWFAFGRKTSSDSTATTSPTAGGNVVFGAGGDYAGSNSPWIDRAAVVLGFVGELSDGEIFALTNSVRSVWAAFASPDRSIWVPVSGGGGTTVTTTTGDANASAPAARLNVASNTSTGAAIAQGVAASVLSGAVIQTTAGNVSAQGVAAALNRAIQNVVGDALAQGSAARLNVVIQTTAGAASAQGINASLSGDIVISTVVGNALASGQTGLLNTSVTCSVGNASAAAATALIESGASILAIAGDASASGIVAAINISIVSTTGGATAQGAPVLLHGAVLTLSTADINAIADAVMARIAASTLPDDIWAYSSRTLTSPTSADIADAVWSKVLP